MSRLLPKNEHSIDRVVRFGIGAAVLSLTFLGPHTPWGLVGLIPLVTALVGSCPVYTLTGLSTRTAKQTR